MKEITITISGSFHKHFSEIMNSIEKFNSLGVKVLSPEKSSIVNSENDFVFLEANKGKSMVEIQNEHISSIAKSDFLWIVDSDGYLGTSVAFELGYAVALGVPIFCKSKPNDKILGCYIKEFESEDHAIDTIKKYKDVYNSVLGRI
ncbi:nucleoside 2-deoxyribosyltransferase [Patescibacteria group bacterium]|nr:nucleoside 2-deoxyribosyltransferase [Patescibacteria group bacterium]